MTRNIVLIILFITISNLSAGRIPPKPDKAASESVIKTVTISPPPVAISPFWSSVETGRNATGMIWDDVNLDGFIDMFIANGNDITLSPNSVYRSLNGVIPNSASWNSANHRYSGHCAVGDINDDGFPEFIVSNYLGDAGFGSVAQMELYLNDNGNLSSMPYWASDDSMNSFSCALGDYDNDGDLDLAVATGDPYTSNFTSAQIYENVNGQLSGLPVWKSTSQMAALDITWGDIDNDGDLDLALATDREGAIIFENNNGTLEVAHSWQTTNQEPANTLILSDINGDDWLDMVVAFNNQLGGNGYFCLYLNDGTGQISQTYSWHSATGGYGAGLSAYDYDNDGDADLAAGRWWDYAMVYECLGDTFTSTPVWYSGISTVVEEMAWVDVDADGVELKSDTITIESGKKLYYLKYCPLYSLDSIKSDGQILGYADYCHDLIAGWISFSEAPQTELIVYYKYSYTNDLAISNWDTANMIFANTAQPNVLMYADSTSGFAPLTVNFSDSSLGATEWLWDFGDGNNSTLKNPQHQFPSADFYDIGLTVLLPDGYHTRYNQNMIFLIADTINAIDAFIDQLGSFEVTIRATNAYPISQIDLPVVYAGDLPLALDSFTTTNCRTDYFENVQLRHYDPGNERFSLYLLVGDQPLLEPGEGKIINLYFRTKTGAEPGQSTTLDFSGYPNYDNTFFSSIISYNPFVNNAIINWNSCCLGIRGNINNDLEDLIDISDLLYLVDYSFKFPPGPKPPCKEEADVNNSGQIDISDLLYLVDYMFLYPPGPDPLPCSAE